ncbi:hypothetical protein MFRU_046g00530 [Monilinia fructicola]|nr:hypothetical protein MFRU_046g00530 [Monilinia fructicola]
MTTQSIPTTSIPDSLSIPFSSTHPQQPFKLLELPPDLLTLLESHNPPTLQITSAPTPPHHAHLTTSTGKTYALRQKNTSNPLMVLEPRDQDGILDPSAEAAAGESSVIISRIATIGETIELVERREGEGEGGEQSEGRGLGRGARWRERFGRGREGGGGRS